MKRLWLPHDWRHSKQKDGVLGSLICWVAILPEAEGLKLNALVDLLHPQPFTDSFSMVWAGGRRCCGLLLFLAVFVPWKGTALWFVGIFTPSRT